MYRNKSDIKRKFSTLVSQIKEFKINPQIRDYKK